MNKRSTLWQICKPMIFLCFIMLSCKKQGVPAELEMTILPGECLSSSELEFDDLRVEDVSGEKSFVFVYTFDMTDIMVPAGPPYSSVDYKRVPTKDVYNAFGDNADKVKELYDQYWQDRFVTGKLEGPFFASTIKYDSGIVLTADKDFAGMKAGENLAPRIELLHVISSEYFDFSDDGDMFLPAYGISFRIPIQDKTIVNEAVTFHLSMPVKVGLLLTWLYEKSINPEFPLPYREETLTCRFTTQKGLH